LPTRVPAAGSATYQIWFSYRSLTLTLTLTVTKMYAEQNDTGIKVNITYSKSTYKSYFRSLGRGG